MQITTLAIPRPYRGHENTQRKRLSQFARQNRVSCSGRMNAGREETQMKATAAGRDELATLFRDVVLVLGGVFAARGTDDETIRRVAAGLERVYRRARQLDRAAPGSSPRIEPHPAIERLLQLTDATEVCDD